MRVDDADPGDQVRGQTDIIEHGPPPRRTVLVAALVVAAGVAGFLLGGRHSTPPSPRPSAPPAIQPIAGTGQRCSAQLGARLQLGVEIVNESANPVTLHRVEEILPLAGLRATSGAWGTCGQLSPPAGGDHPLAGAATTWLTITFDVLVPCPAPLPVLFAVRFTQAGVDGVVEVPGFPDLGDVPYTSTKCRDGS
jgi:hypothetical protein